MNALVAALAATLLRLLRLKLAFECLASEGLLGSGFGVCWRYVGPLVPTPAHAPAPPTSIFPPSLPAKMKYECKQTATTYWESRSKRSTLGYSYICILHS